MNNFDDDFNTPTEEGLDACYGGRYLTATDLGDKKIRAKIARVRMEELQRQGGGIQKKFVLGLSNLDKEIVLNSTNKNTLVDALGKNPATWIGTEIGVWAEPTMFAGKPTKGLRLRVLNKPRSNGGTAPAPTPSPAPAPTPAATAEAPPWPEEKGDPGPDFVDFGEAAE
jgi:hypothetical protein